MRRGPQAPGHRELSRLRAENLRLRELLGLNGKQPTSVVSPAVGNLLAARSGIALDLGCGEAKQPGFVGMDVRELETVDIVHDLNRHPWPLPDGSVIRMMASHVLEHIPPVAVGPAGTWFPFVALMDEAWRVGRPGCEFLISAPYWRSEGFAQDPTHINAINETTFAYFDPLNHTKLWWIYRPKPWYYRYVAWDPIGNIEVLLMRHSEEEERWEEERKQWGPMTVG